MADGSESQTCSAAVKTIAIIGAGCSGLTAIKCCLDEGLTPKCFERSDSIGGLWLYSDTVVPGKASIYKSLVINTSKDMMMFSDFPAPDSFPPFLTHEKVMEYFRLYSQHFNLSQHILFNTEVVNIKKTDNYDITGEWCVRYCRRIISSSNSNKEDDSGGGILMEEHCEEIFQGVMICSGHHSTPYVPKITGLDTFGGSVLHSHAYKSPDKFRDKTVVIIGLGNSAADIACDLAKAAKNVYLSSRRGAWIVPRTAFWGLPADMLANSRLVFTMPYSVLDWCVQKQANFRLDHQTHGLKPNHGVLNCHPSINDELPIHFVNGRVQVKSNVSRVEKDGVLLEDGTFINCDVIIMATGYDYCIDFVSTDILKIDNNATELYEYVFPPHLPHPTLAVIGLVQAIGAVMPISEIQSRWFARLNTGFCNLPPREIMLNDIHAKKTEMDALYVKSRRHTLQTFWIEYMDKIASHIQAKPNLFKIFLTDPELALKCFLGPCLPAQYRLTGPGTWPGARQFIVTAMSRAFRPRHIRNTTSCSLLDKTQCATDYEKTLSDETQCATNYEKTLSGETQCATKECKQTIEDNATSEIRSNKTTIIRRDHLSSPSHLQHNDNSNNNKISPNISNRDHSPELDGMNSPLSTKVSPELGSLRNGTTRRRGWLHPEWTAMTFYTSLVTFCCLAWVLTILFDRFENVLSFVEQTVGRYLPMTD